MYLLAVYEGLDHMDDMFESFRLELSHPLEIVPPNVVLGATVITIQDVGMYVHLHVCDLNGPIMLCT